MRILFAGSPEIAVPSLETLARLQLEGQGFEIAGLLTNPDSPRRHGEIEPTETARAAEALSAKLQSRGLPPIAVLKPEKLDPQARSAAAALKPDLLVSFAYGRIFGPKFLALFPLGGLNIHPSLLPKYRGASPIPAVILGRERETGITIQKLAAEMDSGDILAQESFPLDGRETTASLSALCAEKGAELLETVLRGIQGGSLEGRPQDSSAASWCGLISKEDGRIDWGMAAADIDARIRAFTPWPLSWTSHEGRELCILEGEPWAGPAPESGVPPGRVTGIDKNRGILVQTGEGLFGIRRLQYRAKKALEWRAFLNGARDFIGSELM